MIYSYRTDSNGLCVKGKTYESIKDFKAFAVRHPKENWCASTTEPDLLGRAYSANPNYNR